MMTTSVTTHGGTEFVTMASKWNRQQRLTTHANNPSKKRVRPMQKIKPERLLTILIDGIGEVHWLCGPCGTRSVNTWPLDVDIRTLQWHYNTHALKCDSVLGTAFEPHIKDRQTGNRPKTYYGGVLTEHGFTQHTDAVSKYPEKQMPQYIIASVDKPLGLIALHYKNDCHIFNTIENAKEELDFTRKCCQNYPWNIYEITETES